MKTKLDILTDSVISTMQNELELQTLAEQLHDLHLRDCLAFPRHEFRRLSRKTARSIRDLYSDFDTYFSDKSGHSSQAFSIPTWELPELKSALEYHLVDFYERYPEHLPFKPHINPALTPELYTMYRLIEEMKRLLVEYLEALIELKQSGQTEVIDRFLVNTETLKAKWDRYRKSLFQEAITKSRQWQSLPPFEEPLDPPYTLRFPENFDQEWEYQMRAQGYADEVSVVFEDGREYQMLFCDISKLREEMPLTTKTRKGWWAKPNVIFVNFVTAEDIRQAVERAYQEGYFEKLEPKR